MKSFKTKYQWQYWPNATYEQRVASHKDQKKKHEREFQKLYRKACAYINRQSHYPNDRGQSKRGYIKMGSHYSIWIADDREWCKQCEEETGKGYAIFETSIEIQVLDLGEVKQSLALSAVKGIMGITVSDEQAMDWLKRKE